MRAGLRRVEAADLETVLVLNNQAVPAVNELDLSDLEGLHGLSSHFLVADNAGSVAAFLVMLDGPGRRYDSLNYAWFSRRYSSFFYVDRIVVSPEHQGRGVGRDLYEWAIAEGSGRYPVLCAEVNTRPLNQGSLDFHASMGFVEIGAQDTSGGAKTVAMLARPLP